MSGLAILVTSVDDEEQALALARTALSARLAACVQIMPIRSCYVWKGEMREETEFLLHMKARGEDYPALAELVRRLHSYETPEILRVDVAEASPDYLDWVMEATRR
ncbi:MAG: divalent-cation tolerance protein CutA [Alphaproteobacteria bacterium]|nr:divalent-cation tolerance protein CutA [Alphaproteobacteria bacterium]MBM3653411.1 divalent-cation tolerance protein CutA [Alphaproteobacteria bacterium]